jgi:CO/xanthine dehydrogenase FAD-binding subunit
MPTAPPSAPFAAPGDLAALLALLDGEPGAELLAGGTDFMVEVNAGHRRPRVVVSLHRIGELRGWSREGDQVVLGAGLTYAALQDEPLSALVPALAQASRTVGSPQIRNAGTLGGNLGTGSPAGDTLPVLVALDATVVLASAGGVREVAVADFLVGPKRTALAAGEIIVSVRVPVLDGAQEFLKVGTRNAMVIAVVSVAVIVDRAGRTVRCGLGSVGPTPLRAPEAEAWAAERAPWERGRMLAPDVADGFGARAAAAARPIDDHRSTAEYRRHAVGVCAARALRRAFA